MAVRVITAPPGQGKTLNMTRIAIKINRSFNPFLKRIKENYIFYNTIYSNYPILVWYQKKPFKYINCGNPEIILNSIPLKKYKDEEIDQEYYTECEFDQAEVFGMFSQKIKFTDMRVYKNFGTNASFFIDELQYIYDSMEYKDFPDCIAHFFQVHRHLNVNMIYTNSQSLSRVIKRVLCVSEEFWNVLELKQYFLLPFLSKTTYKVTNEINDSKNNENNLSVDNNSEYITDRFFNKRVYNGYITKYLHELLNGLEYYDSTNYNSLKMKRSDIIKGFNITSKEKEDLKAMDF